MIMRRLKRARGKEKGGGHSLILVPPGYDEFVVSCGTAVSPRFVHMYCMYKCTGTNEHTLLITSHYMTHIRLVCLFVSTSLFPIHFPTLPPSVLPLSLLPTLLLLHSLPPLPASNKSIKQRIADAVTKRGDKRRTNWFLKNNNKQ